jgi:UDP-glucose 4-epimerase
LIRLLNEYLGTKVQPVFQPARVGDVRESLADISEARRGLAYEPQVDFEEGLRRTIAYYRETAGKK